MCFLGALLIGWPLQIAQAQNNWDRYKPGSLAAVIRQNDSTIRSALLDQKPSHHFSGDQFPTLASVIYTGDSRPVDSHRLEVIHDWGLAFMRDSSIAGDFHREYLFQEGKQLLWLPVQDRVASYFARELRPGRPVRLYVMLLGGYYASGEITWAFIVNEFTTEPVSRTF